MQPLKKLTAIMARTRNCFARLDAIEQRCQRMQEALGRIESRQLQDFSPGSIQATEFRVFSQWGQDGILQYLLRHVPISRKLFIEFGVENYLESNTRFLLVKDNWEGLVFDGSAQNIRDIKNDEISWRYNLAAEQAFISRENINDLVQKNGIGGEIGLLSIDVDGNDYWIWEAIDIVTPSIAIVEYNYRFGPERAVTIPYRSDFQRTRAHYSNVYFGASLAALCRLGDRKGYAFVGCNSAGNDAFFVRRDVKPRMLPELDPSQGFVTGKCRESRDEQGRLAFLTEAQEAEILRALPLVEVP